MKVSEQEILRIVELWNEGRGVLTATEERQIAGRAWVYLAQIETRDAIERVRSAADRLTELVKGGKA